MKINIKATNITLTDSISNYVTKKVNMLSKYFAPNDDVLINVEVGRISKHHKSGDVYRAEIQVIADGKDHYTKTETTDLYASIDEAKDEMANMLSSSKKKKNYLFRKGALQMKMLFKGIYEAGGRGWKKIRRKE